MVMGLIDDLLAQETAPQVSLLTQPDSYLAEQGNLRGIQVLGLDLFRKFSTPAIPLLLSATIGTRAFDVTHVHGLRAAHWATLLPGQRRLGSVVYTVHGIHQQGWPAPARWLANRADRRAMRRADATVFVSQSDLTIAKACRLISGTERAPVIPNGIAIQEVDSYQGDTRDVDVAFVGRLDWAKGPDRAAGALAALARKGFRCIMAGDGEMRQHCQRLLSSEAGGDQVEWLGPLSRAQTLELLSRSKIVLMPSRSEGLPLLPMEAMALGAVVVASRLPGIAEVVSDGESGVLTDSNRETMVATVCSLLDDVDWISRLRTIGRQRVCERFDRKRSSNAYLRLYKTLNRSCTGDEPPD